MNATLGSRIAFCTRFSVLVPVLLVVGSSGCSSGPRIVKVSGTLTRHGEPLANAFLTFLPEEGQSSWGITDDQGRYTLNYDKTHDGAVAGRHKILVEIRSPGLEAATPFPSGSQSILADAGAIQQKYGSPNTTPLRVEITHDHQVVDLRLD